METALESNIYIYTFILNISVFTTGVITLFFFSICVIETQITLGQRQNDNEASATVRTFPLPAGRYTHRCKDSREVPATGAG